MMVQRIRSFWGESVSDSEVNEFLSNIPAEHVVSVNTQLTFNMYGRKVFVVVITYMEEHTNETKERNLPNRQR